MFEPISIADATSQIREGHTTPLELVQRCLAQIDTYEDRIHAWVTVDRLGAGRTAERLSRQEPRGPLHGIPLGIKDIIDVAGFPTRAGSPLGQPHVAQTDAPLVAALRRAGAIILGKTVTVEFACFDPSPTLNPWNARHTPGGSSSGSAAAVAMGMCPGAVGTQTGGSLVRPAAYCGVATCKPTYGALETDGIVPVSYHLDHPGPMARKVGDLEIMLRCMRNVPGETPLPERPPEPHPPRLGLLEQFFLEQADEPIRAVMHVMLATLREAGAQIEPVALVDGFEHVQSMHRRIMAVEVAAYHRQQFAEHRKAYGPLITRLLDEGLAVSGVGYAHALAWQRAYAHRVVSLLENVGALIMPSTDSTAPATLATTGTPKFQAPWSCAGLPVVSFPCGLASDGLPVGVQLVGRRHRDIELLEVAKWCERTIALDSMPPILA